MGRRKALMMCGRNRDRQDKSESQFPEDVAEIKDDM